ncbi:hypothetical protein [Brevundimonas naejangsanensis]|uniref:hypothetical protein n=1 Tax=Brevundimonas naejangsanensis TaxID=588932 RepID=UPI0039F6DDD2
MSGPATPVDDVVVRGQRRPNGSTNPFPPEPSNDPPLPGQDATIEPEEGFHACDNPATREDWDTDAAARQARQAIEAAAAAAGEAGLTYRERGVWLLRQANGTIVASQPWDGALFQPGVIPTTTFSFAGINPKDIVGFVHNHDVGMHAPSYDPVSNYGDAQALDAIAAAVTSAGGNGDDVRMYIVAQTNGANPYNKITVYTKANAHSSAQSGSVGPEVNPNATFCPIP